MSDFILNCSAIGPESLAIRLVIYYQVGKDVDNIYQVLANHHITYCEGDDGVDDDNNDLNHGVSDEGFDEESLPLGMSIWPMFEFRLSR
jgi:hypothetical protein